MDMVSTNSTRQSLPSNLDPPANVFVVAPELSTAADRACAELVAGASSDAESALLVSLHESPDRRLDVLRRHGAGLPGDISVVTAGGAMGSATAPKQTSDPALATDGDVRANVMTGPGTVGGIGRGINRTLASWAEGDVRGCLCFHSVSDLLEHVELRTAFRVLHVITAHVTDANAIAHFHVDPTRHDTQTLRTIDALFDTVIEFEHGAWRRSQAD